MESATNKPATKLVEVRLSAITRTEYSEVVEVPANITQEQLDELVNERYKSVDGGEFSTDPEYWERGHCYTVDSEMPGASPDMMAFWTANKLHIERAHGQNNRAIQPKHDVLWLPAEEFAKAHRCSPDFVLAVGPKLVPVLPVGLNGTTSGFEATVLRHYSDGMYEVRVPGGEKCLSWQDLEFEGKLKDDDDTDYWYRHRHELEPEQMFRLQDGSLVKLDSRVPGDGTRWYVADWNEGWHYNHFEIEPGDLRGLPIASAPSASQKASGQ